MYSIKRMVTGILATSFVFSQAMSLSANAMQLPENVTGTRYEEPVKVLASLGIMVGDEDGAFRLDDNLKRSEVAKMAVHALGLEDEAEAYEGQSKFPDVSREHWANGYINLATAQELIIGDDKGNFRPDDSISYSEAMTIFIRALGYEVMAQDKGGYPNGYISVASNIGLSKGVQGTTSAPITRGNVAFLADNALEINLMEKTGFGNNLSYEVTDKTLLGDKLNVEKLKGQVVAIPSTGLTGNSNLKDDEIKIGENVYSTAYNMNNLLGHNVVYYVQENEDGQKTVILAISQKEQNSTLSIKADLFEGIGEKNNHKAIKYFATSESNKSVFAEIEDDAKLIYNGKVDTLTDENLNIKDKSAKMSLLDTDRDGVYDVIFITEYYNIVVEEVTSTNKIVDKYGAKTLKLDDEVSFRIMKGINEIKLSELKEYDVLSVAESKDAELFDIIVSNETVSGKITGKGEDGFYINGTKYEVAKNYKTSLSIGVEGKFYLDIDGKIAAVDTTHLVSDNYGYLIRAYYSQETEKATLRIFTKDGEDKVFTLNEKVKLNGTSGKTSKQVVEALVSDGTTNKQLITYSLNSEDKINTVDMSTDNTSTGSANNNKFTLDYVMENVEFNKKLNQLGNIRIDKETKIFDIQEDVEDYSIATPDMFEDKQKYNVMVFDITEEYIAKAIVVTNAQFQTDADSNIAVVSKVIGQENDEGEITQMLIAYTDGKKVEILAEDDSILVNGENELKTGDIIQYKTNEKGEIAKIRVLFSIDDKQTEFSKTPVEDLEILYGKVTKKFSNTINVTVNDSAVRNVQLPSDINVYSIDSTLSKNNISVVTTGDIQAYEAEEGNRIFIRFYEGVAKEAVIIK